MTEATAMLDEVRRVTNEALIAGLKRLVRADQMLSARLLLHLGEVEERGLYRDQAYPSMFAYCVEELGMFENQAYLRIQVARLGRRFPRRGGAARARGANFDFGQTTRSTSDR